MKAVLKAQINKTDRNDARGIAQMMRAGLYRPVHVKTLRSQKLRMLLTHRKLLQAKAIAIENDLRATLRNFGLKVGVVGTVKFEARIKELVESIPDLAELVEPLLVVRRTLREQIGILHRRLLAIVRELLPKAIHIDVLADPANRETTESMLKGLEAAAPTMGMQIQVFNASAIREIDEAFAALANERPDALFIGVSPFLLERRVQLSQLAARHAIPAIYQDREDVEVGGLMSYGASVGDAYRQLGVYAGRILNGAKPADLPVVQSSKFELVINLSTARMLGLTIPPQLLARADEVIE